MPNAVLYICIFFSISEVFGQQRLYVYYESDKKSIKEDYRVNEKGELDGEYTSFHKNGKIKSKGFFKNNISTDNWSFFYPSGNLRVRGRVDNGENVGLWEYYYESGKKKMEGKLLKGKRSGHWILYARNGKKQSEGNFLDNSRVGGWKYYNANERIKATEDIRKNFSLYTRYYTNGEIESRGKIIRNKEIGTWHYYYESGALKTSGVFDSGEKMGSWSLYYADGNYKAETNYKLGRTTYKEFYKSGALKVEGKIKNGNNIGIWKYFYELGYLEGECNFKNGEGLFTGYYLPETEKELMEDSVGVHKMKGLIQDNKKVGVWEFYDIYGDLSGYYKPYYEDTTQDSHILGDPNMEETYKDSDARLGSYSYKNLKNRHFTNQLNEYRAWIIDYNPIAIFYNIIPLGVEYYMNERLAYELVVQYFRKPALKKQKKIIDNRVYTYGFNVFIRQKFYKNKTDFGERYFAHELKYNYLKHFANINNVSTLGLIETNYEYAILIGTRYFKDKKEKNFTIDIFLGAGVILKNFKPINQPNTNVFTPFNNLETDNFLFSIKGGFHLGYIIKAHK